MAGEIIQMKIKLRNFILLSFSLLLCLIVAGCPNPENGESEGNVWEQFVDSAMGDALGSISGTVYINGRPQAFGTVQAFNEDGQMVKQERCTQYGHFTISELEQGTYHLVYLNARGAPLGEETVVRVRPGRFERVDLRLDVG